MKSVFKTFLQGLVITAPALLTIYVCVKAALWLDSTMGAALEKLGLPPVHGLGVVVALGGVYAVGVLAQTWLFQALIRLAEAILARIPLVKSLYSAVKDLLQFLSGTDAQTRGVPVRLKLVDGKVDMMGLVTQKNPERFMGDGLEGRVAVYLPMSYQIGGFTVFVPHEHVEEISEMTVEDVLKLSMTAGVGSTGRPPRQPPPPPADG